MTDPQGLIKNVLVISYHLPPLGGVPVMRPLRLIKYLSRFGWRSIVFSSRAGFDQIHGLDPSLLDRIPADVLVNRVLDPIGKMLNWFVGRINDNWLYQVDRVSKVFCFPDEKIAWGILTYLRARRIARTGRQPDLIYATGFPWTSLLVGSWLKLLLKKPLVIDLRDSWSLSPVPIWSKFKLHGLLERWIMEQADAIIFTSEGTTSAYQKRYPHIARKMTCIYNGFDPEDFQFSVQRNGFGQDDNTLKLIYAGSLSDVAPPRDRTRSLLPLLEGLSELKQRHPKDYHRLILDVYSNEVPNTRRAAMRLGLQDRVRFHQRLPHRELVGRLMMADIQILIVRRSPDAVQMVPAKLYEYMAASKPILAIAPEFSEAAKLVKRYRLGKVIRYENLSRDFSNAICNFSVDSSGRDWEDTTDTARETFNGVNLVESFAQIFDRITEKSPDAVSVH